MSYDNCNLSGQESIGEAREIRQTPANLGGGEGKRILERGHMWRAAHVTTQNKKSDVPSEAKFDQGCALAEPGGPWCLTFALGRLENL